MISYADFARLLADTAEFGSCEAYTAECGGSVPVEDMDKAIALLTQIWALGHDGLSVDSILQVAGTSMTELAQRYSMPYRTVQNWKCGTRKPPEWLLPMVAYAVLSDLGKNNK